MAAGDNSGTVRIFDTSSRAILRTWKGIHRQPVWVTAWAESQPTTLLTASDDTTVRLWDLAASEPTTTLTGHEAYVRCARFMPGTAGSIISGCYDGTVKLWDPRVPSSAVMTFSHADPVESVLPLPSTATVLAAASSDVSVLDLVAARPRCILSNHQKTVTSLALASAGRRLLTGGLDGHVKILDTSDWKLVTSIKYPSPILALLVAPSPSDPDTDRHLAVSMQSGDVSIRTRRSGPEAARDRQRQLEMAALLAGKPTPRDTSKPKHPEKAPVPETDVVIANPNRKRRREPLSHRLVRQGLYGRALDHALNISSPKYSPHNALSVLDALRHCNGMREALHCQDESRLLNMLTWLIRNVFSPPLVSVCVELALHLVDQHADMIASSDLLTRKFRQLRRKVKAQVKLAERACQLEGIVESFMLGMGHDN
ncbi:hypothetical protein CDD80_1300 [Ophiocordyceps camponoti-rufipedis]|uniref:U3 small nucleolar RNA-associated protein 15 C-terminal domain-containing protein n=1 Tax=Ophiocordyceps camponoti-rufipedis TaxID=2004952 RepID=A0A2C5Y5Q1_9HYPO|nr:hypothetical protein CDD80_1300 [Ophiocordyceps camponoti-rufipedis]